MESEKCGVSNPVPIGYTIYSLFMYMCISGIKLSFILSDPTREQGEGKVFQFLGLCPSVI